MLQSEGTNSAVCVDAEIQEVTVANSGENYDDSYQDAPGGVLKTKRANQVDQGLVYSKIDDKLNGSATSSVVVDIKSALTKEKSDHQASQDSLLGVEQV